VAHDRELAHWLTEDANSRSQKNHSRCRQLGARRPLENRTASARSSTAVCFAQRAGTAGLQTETHGFPFKRRSESREEPAIDRCARKSLKAAPPPLAARQNSSPWGASRWNTTAVAPANKTGTTSSRRRNAARQVLRPAPAFELGVCRRHGRARNWYERCVACPRRGGGTPPVRDRGDARRRLPPARRSARTRATGAGPVHRRRQRRKTPETTSNLIAARGA